MARGEADPVTLHRDVRAGLALQGLRQLRLGSCPRFGQNIGSKLLPNPSAIPFNVPIIQV